MVGLPGLLCALSPADREMGCPSYETVGHRDRGGDTAL